MEQNVTVQVGTMSLGLLNKDKQVPGRSGWIYCTMWVRQLWFWYFGGHRDSDRTAVAWIGRANTGASVGRPHGLVVVEQVLCTRANEPEEDPYQGAQQKSRSD